MTYLLQITREELRSLVQAEVAAMQQPFTHLLFFWIPVGGIYRKPGVKHELPAGMAKH